MREREETPRSSRSWLKYDLLLLAGLSMLWALAVEGYRQVWVGEQELSGYFNAVFAAPFLFAALAACNGALVGVLRRPRSGTRAALIILSLALPLVAWPADGWLALVLFAIQICFSGLARLPHWVTRASALRTSAVALACVCSVLLATYMFVGTPLRASTDTLMLQDGDLSSRLGPNWHNTKTTIDGRNSVSEWQTSGGRLQETISRLPNAFIAQWRFASVKGQAHGTTVAQSPQNDADQAVTVCLDSEATNTCKHFVHVARYGRYVVRIELANQQMAASDILEITDAANERIIERIRPAT